MFDFILQNVNFNKIWQTADIILHNGVSIKTPIEKGNMTKPHIATPERLSALSDGIFAVLITVLVLDLRPPEFPTFRAFLLLWPNWLSYAVSYLFIAIVCVKRGRPLCKK
jgi:hypothetical protein